MITYIIRRIFISIPLLIAISFIAFMCIHMAPGNYFDSLRMNPQISEETIEKYEAQHHFDEPPIVQYFYWLKNLLRLDFGYSFSTFSPVYDVIKTRLFNTFILSLSATHFINFSNVGMWAFADSLSPFLT